jgi:hypothetical protein
MKQKSTFAAQERYKSKLAQQRKFERIANRRLKNRLVTLIAFVVLMAVALSQCSCAANRVKQPKPSVEARAVFTVLIFVGAFLYDIAEDIWN